MYATALKFSLSKASLAGVSFILTGCPAALGEVGVATATAGAAGILALRKVLGLA